MNRQIEGFLSDPLRPLDSAPRPNNKRAKDRDDDERSELVAKGLANCDIKGAL